MDLTLFECLTTVPTLDVDGGNWLIFREKFKTYLESIGLDGHFDAANHPAKNYEDIDPKPEKTGHECGDALAKRMCVWKDGEAKWKESTRAWRREDATAIVMLGGVLPNSIFMEFLGFETFREMREAVERRMGRSTLLLKSRLSRIYCDKRGDVLTHLQELESIYQRLASQNPKISNGIHDQSKVLIAPVTIKDAIRKECGAPQAATVAQNRRPAEVTLHAGTSSRRPGRGRGKRGGRGRDRRLGEERDQSKLACFNCGGKGHKDAFCPSPKRARGDR